MRFDLRWAVTGDAEWLTFWPDCDTSVIAVDRLLGEPNLEDQYWKCDWNRRIRLGQRFLLEEGTVHSFVDIPQYDEPSISPSALREAAIASEDEILQRFVGAVVRCAKTARSSIETTVTDIVAAYRRQVNWQRDVLEGLVLTMEPPTLELRDPPSQTLMLPPRRLVEASVHNLLWVIRKWTQKVEQYPASFSILHENNLSDLLAVTLAVAFGVAEREVFYRAGKTDIYVPVAALRESSGQDPTISDETAWVAEAKRGSGAALAEDAQNQLSGYIPPRAPDAALLFYVYGRDLMAAGATILEALRSRSDHVGPGVHPGSPYEHLVFRHPDTGFDTSVAIIFVHLHNPIPKRRKPAPRRRQARARPEG